MDSAESESVQSVEDRKVPEPLLQKLHEATQRFHELKQQIESVVADAEVSQQERLDPLEEKLRQAERDVEQVTMEIHGSLKPPPEEPNH